MFKVYKVDGAQPDCAPLSSLMVDYEETLAPDQKVFALKRDEEGRPVTARRGPEVRRRRGKSKPSEPKVDEIELMRRRAKGVLDKAQREAKAVEREAYEKGFEQGEKAGRQLGEQKLEVSIRGVEQLIGELGGLRRLLYERESEHVIRLAYLIAEKVVHQTIERDERVVLEIAEVVLKKTMRDEKLVLQLNPQDVKVFEQYGREYAEIAERFEQLSIQPSENVRRGGCIVSTSVGEIDATIDNQLHLIENELIDPGE